MSKSSTFERLVPVLLALAALLTFGWTLNAPTFVAGRESILELPQLSWWKNIPLIFSRHFLVFSDGQFRPLSYALLAAVRTVVPADSVPFWRLWSWAFHWLNALLVFALVRRFSKRAESAFFAALLFAWHPLASVAVNQINHFHYLLGVTFYLGTLHAYLRFTSTGRRLTYVAAILLFALGLLTSKVLVSLPIVLVAYEALYRRAPVAAMLRRAAPFALLLLCGVPFWWFYRPHPLYYKYPQFPPGTGYNSFLTVVGSTGRYLSGLLAGAGIPLVLEEVVVKIMRPGHWRFLLWGGFDLLALALAGWAVLRKRWAGLGVILLVFSLVPFATTAWNRVQDYVSWVYLYAGLVGMALLIGGLLDGLWPSDWRRRDLRTALAALLCLMTVYFGVGQLRLNLAFRSPEAYWLGVMRLDRDSARASFNLGRAYLERGQAADGFRLLFSPAIEDLGPSCMEASRYYCDQGDYLPAAVHLRSVGDSEEGLLFQRHTAPSAALFSAVGAPDYAESALGSALMADPFNARTMGDLAQIWLLKGYVCAAEGFVNRILELSPRDGRARVLKAKIDASRHAARQAQTTPVVPPSPAWLRYAVEGKQDDQIGLAILRTGEKHPEDPVIQMAAATYLIRHGRLQPAKEKMDRVVQSLASFAPAWARKCWVENELGNYAEAERAGRRALELGSKSASVHNALGVLWSSGPPGRRNLKRAELHYRRALELSPKQAAVHVGLGSVLMQQGKLDEAVEHYRKALGVDPNMVEALGNLGLACLRQGKPEEAVAHLERVLELRPDSPTAHYDLAFALLREGKLEQAEQHSRRAAQLEPGYVEAHTQLGSALIRQGKVDEAVRAFQQALQIRSDDPAAHNNLGLVRAQQGRLDEAVEHYAAALRARPTSRETYNNLGMALIAQGRYADAIQTVRDWLRVEPQDVNEVLRLAWLLSTSPDPNCRNALEAAQLARRICEAAKFQDPSALDALGAAYADMGRFDAAAEAAAKARTLALSGKQDKLAADIAKRILLYNEGKPYRLGG